MVAPRAEGHISCPASTCAQFSGPTACAGMIRCGYVHCCRPFTPVSCLNSIDRTANPPLDLRFDDMGPTAGRTRGLDITIKAIGRFAARAEPGSSSIAGLNSSPSVGICCGRRHFCPPHSAPLFCSGSEMSGTASCMGGEGFTTPRVRSFRRCSERVRSDPDASPGLPACAPAHSLPGRSSAR
jgi:hypothetical protein